VINDLNMFSEKQE